VQGAKEERTFYYEEGLTITCEKKGHKTGSQADRNRNNAFGALEYTKRLEGKRVTVYYEEDSHCSGPLAVKIVIYEWGQKYRDLAKLHVLNYRHETRQT
jgi:hypothetical protein